MGETITKDGGITLFKDGTKPLKPSTIQMHKSTITNISKANHNTNNHILNIKEDINTQIVDLTSPKTINSHLQIHLT
ncbi:hypothetical protein AHAS_Ahas11G0189900 [Arachis hypogaea]